MENKYTELILWDTSFQLRGDEAHLVQSDKPGNRIPYAALTIDSGLVMLPFEVFRKNIARSGYAAREVTFLASALSNTYEQNLALAPKANLWSFEEGWNSTMMDEALAKRIANELEPVVRFPGHDYKFLYKERRFQSLTQPYTSLDIRDFTFNRSKKCFGCYLELNSQLIYGMNYDLKKLPKDVVKIEVPMEKIMDAVGFARMRGEPDTTYINEYPFVAIREAKVIPLAATFLLDQARHNKELAAMGVPAGRLQVSPIGAITKVGKARGKGI
jgi:hypothetical protein